MIIKYEDMHRYDDIKNIIKDRHINSLFRFIPFNSDKSLNKIKLDTLEKNYEHVSSPLNFNDPYDCELSFNLLDGMEDFLKIGLNREVRRSIKKDKQMNESVKLETAHLQKELSTEWNKFKQQMAVCCFSEHVDNFLMWSHYANCYNGICIEYDLQEIGKTNILSPVIYTEKLIRARDFMTKEDFNKNTSNGLFEAAIRSVVSKHSQWSYENEWRLIKVLDNNDSDYVKMPIPKNIYIGFKVDACMMGKINQIANKLGVSGIYVTRISSNEYKLVHEQIK